MAVYASRDTQCYAGSSHIGVDQLTVADYWHCGLVVVICDGVLKLI